MSVGISHHETPVAIRERLSLSDADLDELYEHLTTAPGRRPHELVAVSTCNRTELYAAAAEGQSSTLDDAALVAILTGGRLDFPAEHARTRRAADAVRHLCRVAAGLDSMVIGESEVLGQVARAHRRAAERGASGPVLDTAFTSAIRAGRRARSETGIGRHAASVSSEAVRLLRDIDTALHERTVLLVGTGGMSRLAGAALRSTGVSRLLVVSRTTEHAQTLADELHARALPWHELTIALAAADIVISSTGAPHTVLTAELLSAAIRTQPKARVIVDIAVPRDVDPDVRDLPGVRLFDLDELQARVAANLVARGTEVRAVEQIVEEEVQRFEAWRRGVALRPVLTALHANGERVRQRELDRVLRRLGPDAGELRDELERFSAALVNSLLDTPSRRLRDESDPGRAASFAEATRALFGLDDNAGRERQ